MERRLEIFQKVTSILLVLSGLFMIFSVFTEYTGTVALVMLVFRYFYSRNEKGKMTGFVVFSFDVLGSQLYEADEKEMILASPVPVLILQSEGDIYGEEAFFKEAAKTNQNIVFKKLKKPDIF